MKMRYIVAILVILIAGCATQRPDVFPLVVDRRGVVHCLGVSLSARQLRQILAARFEKEPGLQVVLAAAKGAPQKDVDAVLDICRSAGVKKCSFERSKDLTEIDLTQQHKNEYGGPVSNK